MPLVGDVAGSPASTTTVAASSGVPRPTERRGWIPVQPARFHHAATKTERTCQSRPCAGVVVTMDAMVVVLAVIHGGCLLLGEEVVVNDAHTRPPSPSLKHSCREGRRFIDDDGLILVILCGSVKVLRLLVQHVLAIAIAVVVVVVGRRRKGSNLGCCGSSEMLQARRRGGPRSSSSSKLPVGPARIQRAAGAAAAAGGIRGRRPRSHPHPPMGG